MMNKSKLIVLALTFVGFAVGQQLNTTTGQRPYERLEDQLNYLSNKVSNQSQEVKDAFRDAYRDLYTL